MTQTKKPSRKPTPIVRWKRRTRATLPEFTGTSWEAAEQFLSGQPGALDPALRDKVHQLDQALHAVEARHRWSPTTTTPPDSLIYAPNALERVRAGLVNARTASWQALSSIALTGVRLAADTYFAARIAEVDACREVGHPLVLVFPRR